MSTEFAAVVDPFNPDLLLDTGAMLHLYAEIPPGTLRRWVSTNRLTQHGKDARGRGLYRVGDVAKLAAKRRRWGSVLTSVSEKANT